ncbi:hypothetical protein QEN19_000036 [Hanseniaspora menglaensis]
MVYKLSLATGIPETHLDVVKETLLKATNTNTDISFFINYSNNHKIYKPLNLSLELEEEQQNRIRLVNNKDIIKYDIPLPGNNNNEVTIQNYNVLEIEESNQDYEKINKFLHDLGYVHDYEYEEIGELLNVHEMKIIVKIFKLNTMMEKGGFVLEIFSLLENFQDFDYIALIKKNLLALKQKLGKHFPMLIIDRKLMDSRIQDY